MRRIVACALAACLVIVAATAWGYWTADSAAGGNAAAGATTVNQGPTPTANAVGTTVTVSWSATTLANNHAVDGYLVKRYNSSTGVVQTILSACTGTITALSCVESSVPTGSWKYTVTPKISTNWVGQESSLSGTVTVTPADTTAPVNDITLSSVTGGAYKSSATNIFYRGAAAGSFTLTNAVTDAGSGPASSQTATLGNTPTSWTHTGSTVSTPTGGPYVSDAFSWTAGATSSPTEAVTGRDVAGNTAVTNLTITNDSTAPSAGTISYTNGYTPGHSVPVTFTTGTDGGSGIATKQLQRQSAVLTNGTCGSYTGGWSDRGPDSPTSVYTDSSVAAGNCYMYRYLVTDRVGNQHIATSASVSKIDYAGAVGATTGLLSHWRLGEASSTLIASDSFNGTSGALLTARAGEIGATWTNPSGNSNMKIGTENRAYRNASGFSIMYASGTPASQDYSVEADLYFKGALTAKAAGVIGRFNTANTSFYMARWENDNTWDIVKWSNGTPTWLASASASALVIGQTYRIKLEMSGTTNTLLKLSVNGVQMVTVTDSTSPFTAAGKAGTMSGETGDAAQTDSTGFQVENFQVTPSTYPRAADSKGTNTGDYKNGVTLGATGALAGATNTAAQFDGLNDYVQMTGTTGIPVGSAARSVEAWFKTSSSLQQVIFNYGSLAATQEYGLWIDTGGTAMTAWGHSGTNDKTFTLPAAVNDGAWHQVVLTYSGTTLTLYIDGVARPTQAATRGTVMNAYGFGIGATITPGDGNSGLFFNGSIDEVSFYTTVLSQTDVTNHYQLGTVTVPEPIITTSGTDLAYIENGTPQLAPAFTITDADSTNLTAATVDMTTNYLNGQDTLAFTTQNGITGTWTAVTGVMALSGTATVAQYQTAIRSITYNNNSNYPNTSTRTVTFEVSDGTNTSNIAGKNISITAVNDAPTGADGSATLNEDASSSFATADFGMTDPTDNGAHTLTAVKITTLPVLGMLKLNGVNVTAGQTVSAANITSGLLTYTPVLNASGTSYASFTFQVQDTGGTANSGVDLDASANTFTFNVTAVNDAPINSTPGTQSTQPNTAKVFSTGNGNLISISDVDAGVATVQAQLVSTNGATTLSGVSGLTFTSGANGTATMTFTGTVAAVNAALAGLSFNPTAAFSGMASLQIVTNDLGATGTGGASTDSDTVTINVSGRPVVTTTVADLAFTENGSAVALDAGITVVDTDSTITGATISMTTNYVSGQDTLNFSTQNGITGSWVAGTGVLTLTGTTTYANYQTALRSITYSNTANNLTSNNHNVNFVVSDAIGASNTSSRQIAVTAVNDAPVNTVPSTQTTAVNTAEVFTGGSLISISDDATSGSMQVQLVSTNGATTLSGTSGLSFSVGDGTADATMTFTGTVAAINTALAGLSFAPRTGWVGTASLQIVTSDQGNTGSGGTLTDDDTVSITVTSNLGIFAVNQDIGTTGGSSSHSAGTYTVTGQGATVAVTAGTTSDTFQFVHTQMTGDGTLTARVTAAGNPSCGSNYGWAGVMMRDSVAANSMFAMADQRENNSNFADQRSRLTNGATSVITGTAATVAEWVRITRTGNSFTTFRSEDGVAWAEISTAKTIVMAASIYVGLASTSNNATCFAAATFTNVSITTPSVPPVLAASGGTTAHTENVPVAVDSGITVTDVDDTNMESGTVTVGSGYQAGQDVLVFTNQNGITGSYTAPTLTLTGSATKATWQTALRSITYNNTSHMPNTASRTINFVVNDGNSNSNTAAQTVSVAAVNDAPVNTVPAGQTTIMNTSEVFSSGNGNAISIADDAASGDMRVQLVSTNGASTLSTLTGLSFSVGDGTADATMTFDGTVAEVNAALSGLSFNPTTSFTGAASLQIVTSDQGNTGTGGTLTDDDTVAIIVTAPDLGIFSANQDIGGPSIAGSSSHSAGTYTVSGSGADIWGAADQFQYMTVPMTGDGRLTARVVTDTNPHAGAKAGVMMRNTLTSGSVHALMNVMAVNGTEFMARTVDSQTPSYAVSTPGLTTPYWVRLTRVGNTFTAERSPNGTTWTQEGTAQAITMGSTIYVGLAVSAHTNAALHTATFDSVSLQQPPVLAASGGTTAHTENVPVVVDSGITVTDATSTNMASGTVTIGSGYQTGQDVLAFTNQNGISGSWSAPAMTLTGSATKAQWQTALQSVTYNNTSNTPNTGNRTINFVVDDGIFESNTAAKTVSIAAANDAPVNSVPGGQTTAMNTAKVFSGGSLISITDTDAASADVRVQLVSTNGATTLSPLTGLSFTVGDGTADATMTFDGTVTEVNAALSGLSFNPTTSFTGAASLQIVTSDQGNTGTGGTLNDNDTVAITVSATYYDTIWGTTGLLNFYRLGENAISSDAMTGTAGATLQSRTGEVGATWTKHGSSNADTVLTDAGRIRKTGTATGQSLYFTSGQPATPNYTVEADVYVRSNLANDMAGVVGRMDTSNANGTYYYARYEQVSQNWVLYKRVNGSWDWLGESNQPLTALTSYRLALTMSGTTIRVLVDGAQQISVTDSGISAAGRGGVSFGFGGAATTVTNTTGFHVDNFRISPPLADSKGTNHGDYLGGVATGQTGAIAGDANTAALFDGVNDYGTVARQISTDFSIEFWFKSTQSFYEDWGNPHCSAWWQGASLIDAETGGSSNDFGIGFCEGKLIAGVGGGGGADVNVVTSGTYNDGAWHHVVFTRTQSNGAMALYVDGAAAGTATGSTNALNAHPALTFGRSSAGGHPFAGTMDEIALYTSVLSGATVSAHYAAR